MILTLLSPVRFLRDVVSQLLRAILKQLTSKSVPTRQQCFILLKLITEALDGGLDAEAGPICLAAAAACRSTDGAITSSLTLAALSFLASFFRHHSARTYAGNINDLVPAIVRCMKNQTQRIDVEGFAAASALAQSIRPKGSASPLATNFSKPIQSIFTATTDVLADAAVDSEVRERALETLGSLLVHEGDAFAKSYLTCLPLITARLAAGTTATTAVVVIGKVAESHACKGPVFDAWLLEVLPEVVVALRKSKRSAGRSVEFVCLQHILGRIGSALPADTADGIIIELKPLVETPTALHLVALTLAQQPSCRTVVEKELLPLVMEALKTPSVNPNMEDALSVFFAAYVAEDAGLATSLVPALVHNLGKAGALPDATRGGTSTYAVTARCVGVVVEHSQRNTAEVLAMFQKTIKVSSSSSFLC